MQASRKKIWDIIIVAAALVTMMFCASFPFQTVIEIRSKDIKSTANTVIYYDTGQGFREETTLRASLSPQRVYRLPCSFSDLQGLRIDFSDQEEPYTVERILLYHRGKQILDITGNQLLDYFDPVNVADMQQKYIYCIVTPENIDSHFVARDPLLSILHAQRPMRMMWKLFWSVLCAGLLAACCWRHRKHLLYVVRWIHGHLDRIIGSMLVFSLCLVVLMAWVAPAHSGPDEWQTESAIRYYETAWSIPDMRDPQLSHTFSNYGHSRLSEHTPYYFIAGKVSALLRPLLTLLQFPSVRSLNVILFASMVLITIQNRKRFPFLVLICLFTPQIWYIFSYATSDAFDFWLSYLALLQICDPKSKLNRWVGCVKPKFYYALIPTVILGLLLLGKKNYYFTLLGCAIVLGMHWFHHGDAALKKRNFYRYLLVGAGALLIVSLRYGYDYFIYGSNQTAILSDLAKIYQDPRMRDPLLIQQLPTKLHLYQNGVTFPQLVFDYNFLGLLTSSFAGHYGWMEFPSPPPYVIGMLMLYCILFVWIIAQTASCYKKKGVILLLALAFSISLNVVAVIYQCWFLDFQPQGRYLFSCVIIYAFCSSMAPKSSWDRTFPRTVICAIGALSVYSFIVWGMQQISYSTLGIVL